MAVLSKNMTISTKLIRSTYQLMKPASTSLKSQCSTFWTWALTTGRFGLNQAIWLNTMNVTPMASTRCAGVWAIVRPSWVWQRKRYGTDELVVAFANDGVAGSAAGPRWYFRR